MPILIARKITIAEENLMRRANGMNQELLFNKYQIFGVVQGQTEAVKKRVQSIPSNTLLNASERDLVQGLVEEFRLNVPVIKDEYRPFGCPTGQTEQLHVKDAH